MKTFIATLCAVFFTVAPLSAATEESLGKGPPPLSPIEKVGAVIAKEVVNPDLINVFERWIKHTLSQLNAGSELIQTASGPIEYKKRGSGPVILCLHGGFGGYDQAFLMGDHLVKEGFTVLAPSRPGYLRTPLYVGETPEQQADAMIHLLDALKIDEVAVVGFSAGCSVAFQMALRHPNRVWGLVMESLGAQSTQGPVYEIITDLVTIEPLTDFGSWLLYLATHSDVRGTAEFILSLDTSLRGTPLQKRTKFVLQSSNQTRFFKQFMYSIIPLSARKDGILNDINNLDPWQTPDYIGFYPLITTPTMIIESVDDSNGNYQEAFFVSKQIPRTQLVSVGGSGHFIWLGEKTKQWEILFCRFLKTNSP